MVHVLGKGKEAEGWNMTLTLNSLLEGAMGVLHPTTLHPVAELLWNQLYSSDFADLCSVPHLACVCSSF